MIQVSQGGKTVKSSGISSDGNRAVSCAGDVAQFVQAPVTGMLPFGGVEKKKPRTAVSSVLSLHHEDPVWLINSPRRKKILHIRSYHRITLFMD